MNKSELQQLCERRMDLKAQIKVLEGELEQIEAPLREAAEKEEFQAGPFTVRFIESTKKKFDLYTVAELLRARETEFTREQWMVKIGQCDPKKTEAALKSLMERHGSSDWPVLGEMEVVKRFDVRLGK